LKTVWAFFSKDFGKTGERWQIYRTEDSTTSRRQKKELAETMQAVSQAPPVTTGAGRMAFGGWRGRMIRQEGAVKKPTSVIICIDPIP